MIFATIQSRRYEDYLIRLAIATNPHLKSEEQRRLWKILESNKPKDSSKDSQFDKSEFQRLKDALSKNPRFVVK